MLKRYLVDEVTDTRASRKQAFKLFADAENWSSWCSVVRHARQRVSRASPRRALTQ